MTQTAEIQAFLQAGSTLTQLEAYELFKCWRLAPRIQELRASGLDIETIIEKRGKKRYARYRLRGPVQRSLFAAPIGAIAPVAQHPHAADVSLCGNTRNAPTTHYGPAVAAPAGERGGAAL